MVVQLDDIHRPLHYFPAVQQPTDRKTLDFWEAVTTGEV